jgi:hypothetical protein
MIEKRTGRDVYLLTLMLALIYLNVVSLITNNPIEQGVTHQP